MRAYRDQYAELFHNGRNIVVIGISTDSQEELRSWASDEDFPVMFASDPEAAVGQQYGAFRQNARGILNNRTLFVVDSTGRIAWRAAPFREIDPMAYTELGAALDSIAPWPEDPGQ